MSDIKSFEVIVNGIKSQVAKYQIPASGYFKFDRSNQGFTTVPAKQFFVDAVVENVPIVVKEINILRDGDLITSENGKTVVIDRPTFDGVLTVDTSNKQGIVWKQPGTRDPPNIVKQGEIPLYGFSLLDTMNGPKTFTLPDAPVGTVKNIQLLCQHSYTALIKVHTGAILLTPGNNTISLMYTDNPVPHWKQISANVNESMIPVNENVLDRPNSNSQLEMGTSTAISADGVVVVVGCPGYDVNAPSLGAVCTYVRNAEGTWDLYNILTDSEPNTRFGQALALTSDGKTLIVASDPEYYRVLVYKYDDFSNSWILPVQLYEPGIMPSNQFGTSLATNGTYIAVGAPGGPGTPGAVYMWRKNGTTWVSADNYTQLYVHPDFGSPAYTPTSNTLFGFSVAIDATNKKLVIGEPGYDGNTGAVYVAEIGTNVGIRLPALHSDGAELGRSVVISADGNTIAAGAPQYIVNGTLRGLTYVYNRLPHEWIDNSYRIGAWDIQGQLSAYDVAEPGTQGVSIAMSANGNTLIVGDPMDNLGTGSIWLFTRINGTWIQQNSESTTISDRELFGQSVCISAAGNVMVVGAPSGSSLAALYS